MSFDLFEFILHIQSNLFVILWRRKRSVLLFSSSLFLLSLWSWLLYIGNCSSPAEHRRHKLFSNREFDNGSENLIRKLVFQVNRELDAVSAFSEEQRKKSSMDGFALVKSSVFQEELLKILQNETKGQNETMMDYGRVLLSAKRQFQYEKELQRMGVPNLAEIGPKNPHPPKERLVHLDLKGAPPKLSFLKRLLPVLKTLGATGILIEYEDMFPYTGSLAPLRALNAYSPEELKDFLKTVARYGLTVMPLVQTFGHLEFVLKLQGFDHMREIPGSPQSICPSRNASISFLQDMLTQVIEFHLKIGGDRYLHANLSHHPHPLPQHHQTVRLEHIHIGCDEVVRMGLCDKCRQKPRNELFLSHVTAVASFVRAKWPQLKVVIWDDMLRQLTLDEMQHSQIGDFVEPMIWVYANDIYRFIQPVLWDVYSKVFPTAWAASAFKGAFGESVMIPLLQRHLDNNMRWLPVIAKEDPKFSKGFQGLALTGWQRYNHFANLCELLPTAMPSLITSLATVSQGYFEVNRKKNDILQVLECDSKQLSRDSGPPWIEMRTESHFCKLFTTCTYPGSLTYNFTLRLYDKQVMIRNYLTAAQERSAWMSDYNIRHNFSCPLRVYELTVEAPSLIEDLRKLAKEAYSVMEEVFDEHTIAEFIEQNIYPLIVSLHNHIQRAQSLLKRQVWPRRPLPYAQELVQFDLIPKKKQQDLK